jgi:hypothetical protein
VRENAESVAFYRGERDEKALLEEVRGWGAGGQLWRLKMKRL